ncbi:MAG: hypothetical protein ACO1N6_03470 [Microcella sp.]
MAVPSLDDVMLHIAKASSYATRKGASVQSRDLGDGVALFVFDIGDGKGQFAQVADFTTICLMLARNRSLNDAASIIAEDVMEPTDNWIPVDRATAQALLSGDPAAIEHVFPE